MPSPTNPLLPALAPRPPGQPSSVDAGPASTEHTEAEWEAMKPLIEHLYLVENKKLVQLMSILEKVHGFAATQQMYKKRFKKWNIRKRAYRKTDEDPNASTLASASASSSSVATTPTAATPLPASTTIVPMSRPVAARQQDTLALFRPADPEEFARLEIVLDGVCSWSMNKLETITVISDPMSRYLANPNIPPIQDSRTMYRTFELVFDLYNRGQGLLAVQAAQKGFHILDHVLTEDHPDLIWHILDTIYDMVEHEHLKLLDMFLTYALDTAQRRLPMGHPLIHILQQLSRLDYETAQGRHYVCHLLQRAWLRNVDIVGEHIGSQSPRHLWLYEQLIWDSRTRLRKHTALGNRQGTMMPALQSLSTIYGGSEAVDNAERLRVDALALEFTQMDIGDSENAERVAIQLLQNTSANPTRANARFQAYAWKMLARLQKGRQQWDAAEQALRQAVSKREDAHGAVNDVRVIRDMWVLEKYLKKMGKDGEANEIRHDAIARATMYLDDVPRLREFHEQ